MARYRVTIKRSAAKELRGIRRKHLRRITKRIGLLAKNYVGADAHKFSAKPLYRLRQGPYRIAYHPDDKNLLINIFKIGHRREVHNS